MPDEVLLEGVDVLRPRTRGGLTITVENVRKAFINSTKNADYMRNVLRREDNEVIGEVVRWYIDERGLSADIRIFNEEAALYVDERVDWEVYPRAQYERVSHDDGGYGMRDVEFKDIWFRRLGDES